MAVRPEDYEEVVKRINRKYENDIQKGSAYESAKRIPTGSPELNAAMGGGVPIGRWTRFFGGYHSTKTLRSLLVAAEAQKMGMMVAYYDAEKQFDPVFASKNLGVNVDELTIVRGSTVEEIGDKMESLFGVCHLHILDSASICVSEDELNADIRDWRPGISARAWGKVFRRLNERFDPGENTVIMIDQVRVNFKTGSEEAPGGRIFDHQSSMTVQFKKGSWLARNEEGILDEKATQGKGGSGQMEPAGMEIKARVQKSRVCRPFRTATMRLDLDSLCFDHMYEYVKAAKYYGVVETTSKGRYEYNGHKMHGDKAVRALIESDPELMEKIELTQIAAMNR